MRKILRVLAIGGAVLAAPLALADTPKNPGTTVEKSNDINKQVGFIDYYLTDAINGAKLLSILAENAAGTPDKAIISEAQKNVGGAIDKSLAHVQKLHDTASKDKLAQLDELTRQLNDAKTAAGRLSRAPLTDLGTSIDDVSTHLMGADTAFRAIAKQTNYVRLGNTNLSAVPVKGQGTPGPNGIDRDLGKDNGKGTAAPTTPGEDMNVPKGSTHDTPSPTNPVPHSTPGMTSPGANPGTAGATPQRPAPEPTQQAPGQTTPTTGQPGQ
jgi:hypothetical protein